MYKHPMLLKLMTKQWFSTLQSLGIVKARYFGGEDGYLPLPVIALCVTSVSCRGIIP